MVNRFLTAGGCLLGFLEKTRRSAAALLVFDRQLLSIPPISPSMKRFTQSILWISGFLCLLSALLFLWITQTGDVAPMPEQHVGQAAVGTHANPAMPDNNAAGENPSLITGSSRPGLVSQVDKAIPVVQPAPSQTRKLMNPSRPESLNCSGRHRTCPIP